MASTRTSSSNTVRPLRTHWSLSWGTFGSGQSNFIWERQGSRSLPGREAIVGGPGRKHICCKRMWHIKEMAQWPDLCPWLPLCHHGRAVCRHGRVTGLVEPIYEFIAGKRLLSDVSTQMSGDVVIISCYRALYSPQNAKIYQHMNPGDGWAACLPGQNLWNYRLYTHLKSICVDCLLLNYSEMLSQNLPF